MRGIGPVEERDAALIPRLDHHVATRNRHERAVVRDAVLELASAAPASCSSSGTASCRSSIVKSASAPHSCLSVARHFGWPPPPHSSLNSTLVPSLLNVAECQYEKFESDAASRRIGMRGIADVEQQAVAFARAAREPDRRIHGDVVALRRARRSDSCRRRADHLRDHRREAPRAAPRCRRPSVRPCRRAPSRRCRASAARMRSGSTMLLAEHRGGESALRLRVRDLLRVRRRCPPATRRAARGAVRSLKMRGELTIAACSGCASGTLITSMRKSAEFGSWSGVALDAAGKLVRRAHARRAGDVDVDVVRILRIDERRVRVRAAARLHVADVLRIRDVA